MEEKSDVRTNRPLALVAHVGALRNRTRSKRTNKDDPGHEGLWETGVCTHSRGKQELQIPLKSSLVPQDGRREKAGIPHSSPSLIFSLLIKGIFSRLYGWIHEMTVPKNTACSLWRCVINETQPQA